MVTSLLYLLFSQIRPPHPVLALPPCHHGSSLSSPQPLGPSPHHPWSHLPLASSRRCLPALLLHHHHHLLLAQAPCCTRHHHLHHPWTLQILSPWWEWGYQGCLHSLCHPPLHHLHPRISPAPAELYFYILCRKDEQCFIFVDHQYCEDLIWDDGEFILSVCVT